ncbi:hypothetical protein PP182_15095 [Maribacter sp. PR1]|uniref:Uncharacterized protein n=1 Tax=Maribacter cobaltidurans TaxID=1178778 RepID=A0ABU7IX94_9FLAO|nr:MULTISPECIES: hypothetical protein [Maribacter]MDC6390021.1 hypothetical protein [Maribacter sp. PR1]MEE1977411.1 hypothetical protein [Maribacter cobaltidurans]
MNKNNVIYVLFLMLVCSSCVKQVKDAFDETTEALTCANLVQEFEDTNEANPDRSCTAILADIDDLENSCSEYLSESTKESIAELRAACTGN